MRLTTLRVCLAMLAALTIFCGAALAQQPLNTELLQNPGFETGDTTGWTAVSGTTAATTYGGADTPPVTVATAISGGSFLLHAPSGGSVVSLRQSFDLTGNAGDVDAGNLAVLCEGFFGGLTTQPDDARLELLFRDASLNVVGTLTIGSISNVMRNNETTLMKRVGDLEVPVGARTLEATVALSRLSGLGLEALADNLSVQLVPVAAATPAPIALGAELLDNRGFETGEIINPALETAWTVVSGVFATPAYGDADVPAVTVAALMGGGTSLGLCTSSAAVATLSQSFDLRGNAAAIDAGTLAVDLEGYFGGLTTQPDDASLEAHFFDATGIEIPATDFSIGSISSTNRNEETTLMRRSAQGSVPVGTRRLVVQLRLRRLAGLGLEAFADELSAKLVTASTPAPTALDVELLDNGNYTEIEIINPAVEASWTVNSGVFATTVYGDIDRPTLDVSTAIGGGARLLFCPSSSAVPSMQHSFDLTGNATAVDAGDLHVELNGYFGGIGSQPDDASLFARFFDATDTELLGTEGSIGGISCVNRNDETTLMRRQGFVAVPVGARRMVVELRFRRLAGLSCEALADNLSAILRSGPIPAGSTPTFTDIVDRGDFELEELINPANLGSWTVTQGGLISVPYDDPNQPSSAVSAAIGGGLRLLSDRLGSSVARMEQRYPVAASAAQIDSGTAEFTASAYLGGEGSQPDHAQLVISYLDGGDLLLSSDTVGPVTAADRGNVTDLLFREGVFSVPVGTREIVLEVVLTRLSGLSNEAHADNISARFDVIDRPGSGEDVRLQAGIGAGIVSGASNDILFPTAGDVLTMVVDSPMGTRNFDPLVLLGQIFVTGSPPLSPGGFPTVYVNPNVAGLFVLLDGVTFQGVFSPPVIFPGGTIEQVLIPPGGSGFSVILQALALDPGAANGFFGTSDAIELRLL